MTDRNYALSKLGNVTDKARKIAAEVFDAAQAAGHDVWFVWGDGSEMDHKLNHTQSKPVLDFMVRNTAAGDWVRNYIWQHRARLALRHVIWNHRITSTVVSPGEVRWMADRGDSTANHEDHNHAEWFAGSYTAPDGSGGLPVSNPSEVEHELLVDGKLGSRTIAKWQSIVNPSGVDGKISEPYSELVYWVQRYLRDRTDPKLECDGHGIKQDGKFYYTVRALQRYLKTEPDGRMSTPVSTVVKALQRRLNEQRF